MPEFIELMITENKKEIRNLSMFITKAFEIRKKLYYVCPSRFLSCIKFMCLCVDSIYM